MGAAGDLEGDAGVWERIGLSETAVPTSGGWALWAVCSLGSASTGAAH